MEALPILVAGAGGTGTGLILFPRADALPAAWAGPVRPGLDTADVAPLRDPRPAHAHQPRPPALPRLRVPGLDLARRYQLSDVTPGSLRPRRGGLAEPGIPVIEASGAALGEIGLAIAPRRA